VFFRNAQDARAAGYRPCAVCLPAQYRAWKNRADRKLRSARTARSK
jgi:methylphosphotriester-DNA--protein-cysteine methyltransferase